MKYTPHRNTDKSHGFKMVSFVINNFYQKYKTKNPTVNKNNVF